MDLTTAMNIVGGVPLGTPPYYAACGICQLRQTDPHSYSFALQGFQQWQVVLIEQVLGAAIQKMLTPSQPSLAIAMEAGTGETCGTGLDPKDDSAGWKHRTGYHP